VHAEIVGYLINRDIFSSSLTICNDACAGMTVFPLPDRNLILYIHLSQRHWFHANRLKFWRR